jgi:hypothetical protein
VYAGCIDPAASNYPTLFTHPINNTTYIATIDDSLAAPFISSCQYITPCQGKFSVPDDAFEIWLEANGYSSGVLGDNFADKHGDGTAPKACDRIELNVSAIGIGSAVGIEVFIGLKRLFIENNNLPDIDVSALTSLNNFTVFNNNLTSIDVTNNTALTKMRVDGNPITSLNVTNNTSLMSLNFSNTSISGTVDLSACVNLTVINAHTNSGITVLNLGSNINLNTLSLNAQNLAGSAVIRVGTSGRVTLANSLFTVANNSISAGTTFTT